MNREIDQKDVPRMMRDGIVRIGMELEFSNFINEPKVNQMIAKLIGFDDEYGFFVKHGPHGYSWCKHASFPLPEGRRGVK